MTRIGIVADDLTGAMDSAAPFADRGFATRVLLPSQGHWPSDEAVPVLAIDTHSRDLPADAAAGAVRSAFARLDPGRLPFKKIDSTLRGHVAVEIAAAMQASGRRCAVVAPAAPAHGRVLRGGRLFVHDAGGPSLIEMLRAGLPHCEVRLLGQDEAPQEHCVLVGDAATQEDLERIATSCMGAAEPPLLVGSSGLASALAAQMEGGGFPPRARYERLLLVVGSYNARSAAQVKALLAQGGVEAFALTPSGALRQIGAAQRGARVLLLQVEGLGAAPTLDPAWVARQLAIATQELLGSLGARSTALFLTGGDTARAVLTRLGIESIEVLDHLYPGVVHGRTAANGDPLGVVTKAGGFGAEDLFLQAVRDLVR